MKINKFGQVTVTEHEAFEALYSGKISTLDHIFIDGDISKYNTARVANADNIPELLIQNTSELDIEMFDEANRCDWFMPNEYNSFPLVDWLYDQCNTPEEHDRVTEELKLFIHHNLFDLLFYLKFLVDTIKKNKIVCGVGRGSCVSSFILYLIGVHGVNPLRFNLDIHEFLK